ncbi:MAG: nucleotidyltransferase domain-containing protein [Nanoarchaeota archaeon]
METELIKPIVKVGNSAGVVLPKEWYGGKARIKLIETAPNIKKDILEILDSYLDNVLGIYIVGSYARGQQKEHSDVDILVITSDINKKINKGKYEILMISKKNVENALKNNILPILPMLKESKAILNKNLILEYAKTPLTKGNLRLHFETTKSAMKMNESSISLSKEIGEDCGYDVIYSLILRLREVYIVDCLIKDELWGTNEFVRLIKKISGSADVYASYMDVKRNKNSKEVLSANIAEKIRIYILERIKEQEKWLIKKE